MRIHPSRNAIAAKVHGYMRDGDPHMWDNALGFADEVIALVPIAESFAAIDRVRKACEVGSYVDHSWSPAGVRVIMVAEILAAIAGLEAEGSIIKEVHVRTAVGATCHREVPHPPHGSGLNGAVNPCPGIAGETRMVAPDQ